MSGKRREYGLLLDVASIQLQVTAQGHGPQPVKQWPEEAMQALKKRALCI